MKTILKAHYNKLHFYRRALQLGTLLLFILIPVLNRNDMHFVLGTLYSVSFGKLQIIDPALGIQNILMTWKLNITLLIAILIPLFLAIFGGRVFCSWLCPFNFFAELFRKIRWKKQLQDKLIVHRNRSKWILHFVLSVLLIVVLFTGIPVFTLISMPGLITAEISDAILWGSLGIESTLILSVLLVESLLPERIWCKYLCPSGALLALARWKNGVRLNFDGTKCICGTGKISCNKACPIQLDPRRQESYSYCYNCGECVRVCQSEGAALSIVTGSTKSKKV